MTPYDEQQPQDEEQQPKRLDARPKNNIYAPGTGPGTGRTAIRIGTRNRDGSVSPVDAMGAATGPLSQPLPKLDPNTAPGGVAGQPQQPQAGSGGGGFDTRPGRIDARPRNNIYAPGTGPGTGRTAIRIGTRNRDGSVSPVDAMGAATGPLSQPLPKLDPNAAPGGAAGQPQQPQTGNGGGGFGARPGRIDARPRNNIYAPGTGPGTGRTAVRIGTRNRDGSVSPVDAMGAATGPLSQPLPNLFTPRPTPAAAYAQGQNKAAQSKASDTSDGAPGAPPAGTSQTTPASSSGQTPPAGTGQTPPAAETGQTTPDAGAGQTPSASGTDATAATPPFSSTPQAPDTAPTTPPEDSGSEAASEPEDPEKDKSGLPPGLAKGGPVRAGRPYLVGEKGPEIIVPRQSGCVVPNHALKAAALRAVTGRQTQPLPSFLKPRRTPAEAYAQMRVRPPKAG